MCWSSMQPAYGDWLMECGDCRCKWNSGKKTADCKNRSMAAVPDYLSMEIQVLDLSNNHLRYLKPNVFLSVKLHNLQKLFIRNNSLQQMDVLSFTQLEILIELDLSNNLLRSLQVNQFARLIKLRALLLNGNLLEKLGDGIFQNLKYLHKIELKHNRLLRVGTRVFVNLPFLSQIYLDNNRLSYLRKESFDSLKRLTALSLDQNPWNCSCELQAFKDFVLRRKLYTPPTACHYPPPVKGMLWVDQQPEAFVCAPKIMFPARNTSINASKENVTLICRIHATQETLITWDYNKHIYQVHKTSGEFYGSAARPKHIHVQLVRDRLSRERDLDRDIFVSRLTILGADKSDEGVYTCLAENAGGKDAVQMTLYVEESGPRTLLLLRGNTVVVISIMALGFLSITGLFIIVAWFIYRRLNEIYLEHNLPHDLNRLTKKQNHDNHDCGNASDSSSSQNLNHHLPQGYNNSVSGDSCLNANVKYDKRDFGFLDISPSASGIQSDYAQIQKVKNASLVSTKGKYTPTFSIHKSKIKELRFTS